MQGLFIIQHAGNWESFDGHSLCKVLFIMYDWDKSMLTYLPGIDLVS